MPSSDAQPGAPGAHGARNIQDAGATGESTYLNIVGGLLTLLRRPVAQWRSYSSLGFAGRHPGITPRWELPTTAANPGSASERCGRSFRQPSDISPPRTADCKCSGQRACTYD